MTQPDNPLDLPDRAVFWRWVVDSVRPVVGWVLVALGALALLLGWFGVSGQSLTSKQLPYLVSGGFTGIALVVVAATFLATDDFRRQLRRLDDLERKVEDLHALFATDLAEHTPDAPASVAAQPVAGPPSQRTPADADAVVALPSGTSYHRSSCALAAGKADAVAVDARTIRSRGLRPCRVCDPEPVTAGTRR